MKRAIIWRCNGCGREVESNDSLPHDWFYVELASALSWILRGDYCGKECLEKALMEELKFVDE